MSEPKALVYFPFPLSHASGALRVLVSHHTALAASGIRQDLVCPANGATGIAETEAPFERIFAIPQMPTSPIQREMGKACESLDCRRSLDKWAWYQVLAHVPLIAHAGTYEVVIIHYHHNVFLVEQLPARTRTVGVVHDVIHDAQRLEREVLGRAVDVLPFSEELKWLGRFDLVAALGHADAEAISRCGSRVVIAPPVFDPDPLPETASKGLRIFTISSRDSAHSSSVLWALENVWPRILAKLPDAIWTIAGECCADIQSLPPRVNILGKVSADGLRAAYQAADVGFSPFIAGVGCKIKTLEAMSHGKPVVATPLGATGAEAKAGDGLFVSSDPSMLARLFVRLADKSVRVKAGAAALEYIRKHHSASALLPYVEAVYGCV